MQSLTASMQLLLIKIDLFNLQILLKLQQSSKAAWGAFCPEGRLAPPYPTNRECSSRTEIYGSQKDISQDYHWITDNENDEHQCRFGK
jgi:hypothetical protein